MDVRIPYASLHARKSRKTGTTTWQAVRDHAAYQAKEFRRAYFDCMAFSLHTSVSDRGSMPDTLQRPACQSKTAAENLLSLYIARDNEEDPDPDTAVDTDTVEEEEADPDEEEEADSEDETDPEEG